MNEKELKELILKSKGTKDIKSIFEKLGFNVEESEDNNGNESFLVVISPNDLLEIIFYKDIKQAISIGKMQSYGKLCTLGISNDFEEWVFIKRIVEDGVKLKKFKFSKTKLKETPKPIAIQKMLSFQYNDLKAIDDLFTRKDVTKKFYDEFKKLIELLKNKITGIPEEKDRQWYSSVIVNRILFIYFIQHKELLGNRDKLYLSRHLKEFAKKKKDVFYKEFLTPLFLEGLSKKNRDPIIEQLLELVPYLNGGLFQKHILEKENIGIQIPDVVFEKIFQYLDTWNWHLDEKHDTEENEINPEVLGYIFEKLINQKQMGAYYTKEDITGYISKNTIIPRLLDMVKEKAPQFFEGKQSIFQEIFQNPDLFIYNSIQFGIHNYNVLDQDGRVMTDTVKRASSSQMKDVDQDGRVTTKVLPEEIEVGIKDVSQRTEWNKVAEPDYALPTETWREVVARRQRYFETKSNLEKGLGADGKSNFQTNDLITYNLNIIDFILHTIRNTTNIQFVELFYEALQKVTILDPTCGSGAFLFSALNILEDLYEVCLDRLPKEKEKINTKYHIRYHIYKTIILNNLYGVDIMEEAVEICKLRLFLKLISQVERQDDLPNFGIEPLPDIDFNILSGNTLVGFAKLEDIEKVFSSRENGEFNFWIKELEQIQKHAIEIEILHDEFIKRQLVINQFAAQTVGQASNLKKNNTVDSTNEAETVTSLKEMIKQKNEELNEKLNLYLAKVYGVNTDKPKDYQNWKESHKPFHWVTEFYSILKNGGFDVIIGNPPYVALGKIDYNLSNMNYSTINSKDLFALTLERSITLQFKKGLNGFIIPLSATSTNTMDSLKNYLFNNTSISWNSYFSASDQPASLFNGVRHRLLITINIISDSYKKRFSTNFLKWFSDEREYLFKNKIKYIDLTNNRVKENSKMGSSIELAIIRKLQLNENLLNFIVKKGYSIYYHNAPVHWGKIFNFIPHFSINGKAQQSSHIKALSFNNKDYCDVVLCLLNSSLFYWFNWQYSNCRDLSLKDIENFPLSLNKIQGTIKDSFTILSEKLMQDYKENKKLYKRIVNEIPSEFDSFYPMFSKPIIDEIDKVLASHYGFTEEELDYIINYDIKYRMGKELNEDE